MKRCKDRKCDGYYQRVSDECTCCPICRGELMSDDEHFNISMGNADISRRGANSSDDYSNIRMGSGNAISGGVHSADDHSNHSVDDHSKKDSDNVVNSNNETHNNSHNTTNNTTIYEAKKSESERLQENINSYRLRCKLLFKNGLISSEEERELRELQYNLHLADELVLPIKEEIRLLSKKRKTQLSSTGLSDIRQTKSIIEQNTAPALQRQLGKLESWMQEYDDNTLKFMYYQMSSMLGPVRYTNRYEDCAKDEYWEVYWVYIAYLLQNREKQANEALASLGRWHAYYPEQNDTILLLAGRLMHNEPIEDIQQVRNQLTAHFTPDLQLLLDAIDELLQMDWAKESVVIRPAHSFYVNTLFGPFVETQKAAGLQRLREWREQEKIKREEEERIRLAELERQNQIREKKTSVLQKFQEISSIEIACQKAGVEFHTFNIWLEEDSTFAASYNEIVHCMEVRKYEEDERKRKAQVIEAETKQKKSKFKILFEQNKCDLLKTCSELGISSADYQEWRRMDSVFNDEMNYIIRENQKVIDQQYRQKRAKIIKKVSLIIGALAILLVLVLGATTIINNINETKAEEEARREQEENQKREIKNQHESLINTFNDLLADINKAKDSSTPNVEEFNSALISLEKKIKEIQSFEASNPLVPNPQYSILRQTCIDTCVKLDSIFNGKFTNHKDPKFVQNYQKWGNMRILVKSLKDRL